MLLKQLLVRKNINDERAHTCYQSTGKSYNYRKIIYTWKQFFNWDDDYTYIVDAVDDVKAKINLIVNANKHNLPIMSSMGTANKLDPQKFVITDIYKTHTCPLARIMRKTLKQQGIKN